MNPPILLSSKVGDDPHEFIDYVYKILSAMGVTTKVKAKLTSYELREVAQLL